MKILYVNHYAGSPAYGMEYRPFYMAREWVRAGHQVRIVAADRSHIRAVTPDLKQASRKDEAIEGVCYSWLKTPVYDGNGFGRVKNMASFVGQLYSAARSWAEAEKPDVVIASSTYPMDIWAAKRIADIAKARLVFEVHDLWPLSPMELGNMSKWHPFIMVVQAAEDYAYRKSDVVVSMLPMVHSYMQSRGLDLRKLHIVPNGISLDEWQNVEPLASPSALEVLGSLKAAGRIIVGYAGTHGVANALGTLLDAANIMRADERVAFVLVGMGPDKAALQLRAKAEGLRNLYFIDSVPKVQIPALLECFDIAFIGWHRQALYRFGISPNKLMDYMMAGRAVLHSVEAGNDAVGEARCGLTVEPENPQAIVQGLFKLIEMGALERQAMGERGRKYVLENHTYPVLAKRFIDAFV